MGDEQTEPIAVTADSIRKWGPWFAAVAVFLVSATSTVVLAYFSLRASIAAHDVRLAAIETAAPQVLALDVAQLKAASESDARKRDELLGRMKNIEKFLAGLVCKQTPAECPQAMALIGQ